MGLNLLQHQNQLKQLYRLSSNNIARFDISDNALFVNESKNSQNFK